MNAVDGDQVRVEIVFAGIDRQELMELDVPRGSTVADVLRASAIADLFPDCDFDSLPVGIWGRTVRRSQAVASGDRVEIYRPLARDPREARRSLAIQGRRIDQADKGG